MTLPIEEVSFETFKAPAYNTVTRALISITLVVLSFASFAVLANVLGNVPNGGLIALAVAAGFFGTAYWYERKTLLNFEHNGYLIINSSGFTIQQEQETHIPYQDILFMNYFYDRPASSSKNPPPATYKFRIKTRSQIYIIYVRVKTTSNEKNIAFVEIMDKIQSKSSYFYSRIRYRK